MSQINQPTFLTNVNLMFDRAANLVDMPPGLAELIKQCNSVYQFSFPVGFADGYRTFEGWLSAVRQSFNLGGSSSHLIAESMNAYLRNWLINHILESDMAYRDTLTISHKK